MLKYLLVLFIVSSATSQGIVDPRCPTTVVRPSIRLPHETDCSRFYICQLGLKHLMPACPKGLLYDAPTSACVDEKDAKCDQVIASTTGSPTVPAVGSTTVPSTATPVTAPTVAASTAPPATLPPSTATPAPTVPIVTGTTKLLMTESTSCKYLFNQSLFLKKSYRSYYLFVIYQIF
jgi:Chitin binding Peritrophin-A domain